ncbi:hypothetical protein CsSME_00045325 [Camellia sinensis var. sinensis]
MSMVETRASSHYYREPITVSNSSIQSRHLNGLFGRPKRPPNKRRREGVTPL